jgi:peptidoglycan/LPS O-acetylase OafA/YrhL
VTVTAAPRQSDRIPTLDGLRAVAILIVIASHVFHSNPKVAALGHMGVLIFFALSGYLITARLLVEYRSSGRISLRDFYLRRAFRILPPALVYLGVLALLSTLGLVICSGPAIRSALFFYTNYIDVGLNGWRAGHFWSLSVEEHFYLLWPGLLLAFGVCTGWRTAVALVCVIFLWRIADSQQQILARLFHDPFLQGFQARTDLIADTLLWGCCLAFCTVRTRPMVSTVLAVSAGALLALFCADIRLHESSLTLPIEHLLPAILVGAVVSCPTAPIGRLLELAPMRFIGHLSYSLYIWQQLFLFGPRVPLFIGLPAALACAYLSYRFVEQPCIRMGKRFIAARQPVGPIVETS